MAGIGNTVETDLVGELAELWSRNNQPRTAGTQIPLMRGVIRAVTTSNGSLIIWFECTEPYDTELANYYMGVDGVHAVGDIVCAHCSVDGGQHSQFLRLIKQPR